MEQTETVYTISFLGFYLFHEFSSWKYRGSLQCITVLFTICIALVEIVPTVPRLQYFWWSHGSSWTNHEGDHTLITWLCMHWSQGWSCTDHVADHALFTCLIMNWSRGWPCTDHVADHTVITGLIMHWLRCWSCTAHVAIMHWSHGSSCTDTWLNMQESRGYHALFTCNRMYIKKKKKTNVKA